MYHDHGPSGFICINKPSGMTSFDVIRELRRSLRIKKLGHSGVLDRPASGVLVVGAGQATRLFELFGAFEKEYEAEVWLGLNTTTDDLTGERLPAPAGETQALSAEAIAQALQAQVGEIDQVPPAFSLTKVEGRELYRYALAGEEVAAAPKRVSIQQIEVLDDAPGADIHAALPAESKLDPAALAGRTLRRVRIHVLCSGGVYVRSIARDAGALLGCGGTLGRLVRTRVGPFSLENALTLDDVAGRMAAGASAAELLQPLSCIATADSSVPLDSSQLALVASGRSIRRFSQQLPAKARRGAVVYGMAAAGPEGDRRLAAILTVGDANPQGLVELRPSKVLIRR
jgi:tRNA pseudouridine55 synthase